MLDKKISAVSARRWVLLAVATVVLLIIAGTGLGRSGPNEPASTAEPYQISLWNTIAAGGIIGLLIMLVSLAAVALIVENFLSIRRDHMVPAYLIDEVRGHIEAKKYGVAQQACREDGSFLAQVVGAGLGQIGAMFGFFDMQNAMQEVSEREISKLYRKLEYLSFIATTSPMLGLLGTVTGMIASFQALAEVGLGNPEAVAGGISEALITTATGLVIALPVQAAYNYFNNKVSQFALDMEISSSVLLETFNELEAEVSVKEMA